MDYVEARGSSGSSDGHQVMLNIYDLGTGFLMGFPSPSRKAHKTQAFLREFKGRNRIQCMYADRANELDCAAAAIGIHSDKSRAGRPQASDIIERSKSRDV